MATTKTSAPKSLAKPLTWILIVSSLAGLFASFMLTYDKLKILEDPSFHPNCNLNPVISCGNVMVSHQATAFGFPNPWIGLVAFGSLLTVGMAMLAGAKFKRWFWYAMYAGITLGLAFAMWLLIESIYSINALCPYCLLTDVAVITLFWYSTLFMIEQKYFPLKARMQSVAGFARRHHLDILVAIFVVIIAVILNHFWYYYGQYL